MLLSTTSQLKKLKGEENIDELELQPIIILRNLPVGIEPLPSNSSRIAP